MWNQRNQWESEAQSTGQSRRGFAVKAKGQGTGDDDGKEKEREKRNEQKRIHETLGTCKDANVVQGSTRRKE